MPKISEFYGIAIRMFFNEEKYKKPHFHAYYGEHQIVVTIDDLNIIEGDFPKQAKRMVLEWAGIHQKELAENYEKMRARSHPEKIKPLE